MADAKLNVGVIGVGYWGKNLLRLAKESAWTRLVGLCDMHPPTLAKAAANNPGLPACASVAELLEIPELEAVIIVVPAECDDLIACAQENDVRLFVDHTFLFNSSIHKIQQIIDGDTTIGSPLYFYAKRTNLGPFRTDVSALWDLATHDIAIVLYLMRTLKPSWVSCTGSKLLPTSPVHDVVFLTIGFEDSPFVAHVHASWMDPSKEREIVVVCGKARIVFEDTELLHPIRIYMKGPTEEIKPSVVGTFSEHQFLMAQTGDVLCPHYDKSEPLAGAVQAFVRYVQDPAATSPSDGMFGKAVVRILAAGDLSLAENGKPVILDGSV